MCLAHDVVVSDGVLKASEQYMMAQLVREIGLAEDFEPHYIPTKGVETIFNTHRARVAVIINLMRLGYADGAFEIEEQFLLKDICRLFSFTNQDFAVIENWVRRLIALEEEAETLM